MKRVLIIINNICFLHSHRKEIVAAVIQEGYDVHIASPANPTAAESIYFEKLGAKLIALPMSRSKFNPIAELWTLFCLFRIFLKIKPKLFHSVTMKPNIYSGLINCLFRFPAIYAVSGLGTVFIARGFTAWIRKFVIKFFFKQSMRVKSSKIIVQNDDDQNELIRAGIASPSQLVMIRGSGVDTELFSPREKPSGKPVVALASRLLKQKGILEFFDAAKLLREEHAKFVLIGDIDSGNPSSLTTEQVRSECASSGVEWLGFRSDMHRVLNTVNVLCLPSYREGLPKSLIEGAACGLPLIATNVPGCRDVVHHGKNGLLVEARDVNSLAAAIKELIVNSQLRKDMGQASRRRAINEWRLEETVKLTLNCYKQSLTKR